MHGSRKKVRVEGWTGLLQERCRAARPKLHLESLDLCGEILVLLLVSLSALPCRIDGVGGLLDPRFQSAEPYLELREAILCRKARVDLGVVHLHVRGNTFADVRDLLALDAVDLSGSGDRGGL